MGDLKTGHYYEKQLMLAPTPGKDFKAEVIYIKSLHKL